MDNLQLLLILIVALPGAAFLGLALVWLLGWTPPERVVARITATTSIVTTAAAAALAAAMVSRGTLSVRAPLGHWFTAGEYDFVLSLLVDRLSLPMVVLTTALIGIVGAFSVRYLHRERGYFRFFLLLHLFTFGSLLAFTAGSFDLLIGGWELVGITSVLLIAFFDDRREPVRNALRVFATYRIADLGLLIGVFAMHYLAETAAYQGLFTGEWPSQGTEASTSAATIIGLLLLVAAAGKSAQMPFSGWLPRAMEGPTPSSAIFYGAISVHAGAYILLRAEPLFRASPAAAAAVVATGAATAILATLTHRVVSDAKTSLAYASMTQLGIIFVEIGLGFPMLALAHMSGHTVVRTLQFLRAPSMLHDYHRMHAAAGGHLGRTGEHYHGIIPPGVRLWLYRAGLERGFYDALVDRFATAPVLHLSRWLASLESSSHDSAAHPAPAAAPVTALARKVEG
ncbi:MAG: proton-conducting transporter membrane subunit [Bryobacteraceae bacterium]